MKQSCLFKIAVLNDLIGLEVRNIDIENVLNPITKSKLRNLKKSSDIFTKFIDELFKEVDIQMEFGEYCDRVNKLVDEQLKEIV